MTDPSFPIISEFGCETLLACFVTTVRASSDGVHVVVTSRVALANR